MFRATFSTVLRRCFVAAARESCSVRWLQIVLLGDLGQLPPVVDKDELRRYFHTTYRAPYFFAARVLEHFEIPRIELLKNYRQNDAAFLRLLSKIRTGDLDSATLKELNQRNGHKASRPPKRRLNEPNG